MRSLYVFVVCLLCLSIIGCKENNSDDGTTYRPEGFPEILTPLEDATEIRYLSPDTGRIAEGAYSLSYRVVDDYPATKIIERIRSHLKSYGCVRVEWMPDDYAVYVTVDKDSDKKYVLDEKMTQDLREELKENQWPGEPKWQEPNHLARYRDIIYSSWQEEWITPDNELFSIILQYSIPKQKENNIDQLFVNLTLFTPSSWKYPYIQRFKNAYPEKFCETKDSNGI